MPSGGRILVLEDDQELLEVLTAVLADRGYQVTPVTSGQEAVDAVSSGSFDLLVADIRMEGMSGLDAVEASRRHQPGLATLIISGFATPENTARAMQLQAGKILAKPFNLKDFVQRVEEQLSLRQKTRARDKREESQQRSLTWALQSLTNMLSLVEGDSPASLCQELSQRVARQLGLSRQVSQEVGLAAALLASEQRLGGIPDWFLQDSSLLPTLKYCLEHHDTPLDIDPPRVEARIVTLALAVFDDDWHLGRPYPEPDELSDRGLDPTVLQAYQRCLESQADEKETGEAQADYRQMLALANTLSGFGELEGARRAYAQVVAAASGRELVGGLLGSARLELRAHDIEAMKKAGQTAVTEAARLGPVTYATTLLEVGLLGFRAGADTSVTLKNAVGELGRLGFDGSVAVGALALMDLGLEPNPEQLTHYLQALTQPRYAEEVAGCASWLVPTALKLLSRLGLEEHRRLLLRLLCSLSSELVACLAGKDIGSDVKESFLEQLAVIGGGLTPTGSLETLALDPSSAISKRAQELQKTLKSGPSKTLLRCRSFGLFEVSCGQEVVRDKDWKTKKVRYYFAYLASNWGNFQSDDVIIEMFWPNKSRERGKKNLYWATSIVRNCLSKAGYQGEEVLERREETLRLNPEATHWHDLQEFESLHQSGMRSMERGHLGEARSQFSRLAEVYTGPFLEGHYADWAVRRRDQLQMMAIEGLCALATCCLQGDEGRGALEAAHRGDGRGLRTGA